MKHPTVLKTLSIDSVQDEQSLKTNDVPIRITNWKNRSSYYKNRISEKITYS